MTGWISSHASKSPSRQHRALPGLSQRPATPADPRPRSAGSSEIGVKISQVMARPTARAAPGGRSGGSTCRWIRRCPRPSHRPGGGSRQGTGINAAAEVLRGEGRVLRALAVAYTSSTRWGGAAANRKGPVVLGRRCCTAGDHPPPMPPLARLPRGPAHAGPALPLSPDVHKCRGPLSTEIRTAGR